MARKKVEAQDVNYLLGVAGAPGLEGYKASNFSKYKYELLVSTWITLITVLAFFAGTQWSDNKAYAIIPAVLLLQTVAATLYSRKAVL